MNPEIETSIARFGSESVHCALEPFVTVERKTKIESVLAGRMDGLSVVFENLHDPRNGAAAIRSAEAFGISTIHAVESNEPFIVSKAVTIGCQQWVEVHRHPTLTMCSRALETGTVFCATLPDAEMTVEDLDPLVRRALVFGNEHDGLSNEAIERCEERVRIPMHGFSQSLNLSVSAALLMSRAAERRRHALGRAGDLTPNRLSYLRARWYSYSIRGAAKIVARFVSQSTPQ
jgi:tRNA (guanosine-2'-O-)-methyltransferase